MSFGFTTVGKVLVFAASLSFVLFVTLKLYQAIFLLNVNVKPEFDFVPFAPEIVVDCDQLFGLNTAAATFSFSSEYQAGFPAFESAVKNSTNNEVIEGHSMQLPTQVKVLHYLTSRLTVNNICETGFNGGHSSFNYLTANRHSVLHSFDLGSHKYAYKMASFLRRKFPSRFYVHFGDSRETVPHFARTQPRHRCDFMHVDGGHTLPIAMADLLNLASMANVDTGNIIMFDDYPTPAMFTRLFGWAWENMRRWGYVRELLRCSFKSQRFLRGFVIGTVIRRPNLK